VPLLVIVWLLILFSNAVRADEVYIWQRQWHQGLLDELAAQKDLYRALRVLALQQQSANQWVDVQSDVPALVRSGLPITLVVRLPGSQPMASATQLGERVLQKLQAWRAQGLVAARVEIDFDCAESKLSDYQQMLQGLRQLLPENTPLDITALPSWLGAKPFVPLVNSVDRITLQVHAVQAPKRGLFDPRMAEFWVRKLSQLSQKPFSVALPAYGARLILDAQDRVIGVEHEMDIADRSKRSAELDASPQSVRALLDAFSNRPVKNLESFVWFRLPLSTDQRAWHPNTLRALIEKRALFAKVEIRYVPNNVGGFDVVMVNVGNLKAPSPFRISVNPQCHGEGLASYQLNKNVFITKTPIELTPAQERTVAWLRCPANVHPQVLSR
jgi:hypothetical protein